MGQSKPFRATALVVEDDPMQREMICLLLEESDHRAIKEAIAVLNHATEPLAERRMDKSVAQALKGQRLSEIES